MIDQELTAVQQGPEKIFQTFTEIGSPFENLLAFQEFIGGRLATVGRQVEMVNCLFSDAGLFPVFVFHELCDATLFINEFAAE